MSNSIDDGDASACANDEHITGTTHSNGNPTEGERKKDLPGANVDGKSADTPVKVLSGANNVGQSDVIPAKVLSGASDGGQSAVTPIYNGNENTNDTGQQTFNKVKEFKSTEGASQEDKSKKIDITNMSQTSDGKEQKHNDNAPSTDNFHYKTPGDGDETSANENLDEQQIANTCTSPRPVLHDAMAKEAETKQGMARNRKPGAKPEDREHDKTRRNAVVDDEPYAEMEQRLLKSFTESSASMKTSLQRLEIIVYGLGSIVVVLIIIMCNGSGTPSTTPNLDLDKIKTQLQEFQGNMKHEMLELKKELSSDISSTKQVLIKKIPDNEAIKETSSRVVKHEIENSPLIKTMENDIKSNKETFATIDKTILNIKKDNEKNQQQLENITENMESIIQSLETTANDLSKKLDTTKGTVNTLEMKISTTEKNVETFEMKFATQEQLGNMKSFIKDAKQQVEQLNIAMEQSKQVLQKYGDTQKIIHQNTFDKDAMIYVLLIIIGCVAGLCFYVCVYKPWQPKESRQYNASEAQKALSAVPDHPVLGNSVCIISFKSNRSADYGVLVGSALEVGTNPMIHVITNHADIPRLPLCKMYIMCVEFSERHVIIEEPGLALGDMKRTTYNAVNKMGGALVILYVNHRGSMRSQDLYSDEIYCVNKQPELQTLETRNRFISTYDQLNDRQKNALKQAVREALKKSV